MDSMIGRAQQMQQFVVTAAQMRQIEARLFAAGMPVAALMEKVVGRIVQRLMTLYPRADYPQVGVLVGPGHNGGDALGVARELHFQGYSVTTYCPFGQQKELTAQHAQYCASLGIPTIAHPPLNTANFLIDGLFGFGLERPITSDLADQIQRCNQSSIPIVSLDLPSGLHTDTGAILGTAICATQTLCLGLWKQGLLQDHALAMIGAAELIDFDIPLADVLAILGDAPPVRRVTDAIARSYLPLHRPLDTHKYKMGHLLLICGSQRYMGAAILAGLAARATGVGMLSIAVPASLKAMLVAQIPDALILSCPESTTGAIAHLPPDCDLKHYTAIACGPGLTPAAQATVQAVLASDRPLVLDADGLNCLAALGPAVPDRSAPTILTPHLGEFQRLFPQLAAAMPCRIQATQTAAQHRNAIVLLKGARVVMANPDGETWINPTSTPALARGGTGDVLTGLIGGLLAQTGASAIAPLHTAVAATWWHAQAAQRAAQDRTLLGVDASTLVQYLVPSLNALTTPGGKQNPQAS
jgi:ADP-dependent NAD(P)H-hydrate dehydratase / NAD(P)H-hydrate epimerase